MSLDSDLPYCFDLPTTPLPEMGKILVTGATGYVGGRLVEELLLRGYDIRVLARVESPELKIRWPEIEVVVGDALDYENLRKSLKDIEVTYYLIHSLLLGRNELEEAEKKAATNFRQAAEDNNVKRIIYLGGLVDKRAELSVHMKSRLKVAEELSSGTVPVTVLRAAMIIGSGSASFEILKQLSKNLRILLIPKWAKTRSQPIGIRDVIKYLIGVLELDETTGISYDIGGRSELTYADMLKILSGLLAKKKLYIPVSVSGYTFFGYIASLVTPVPAPIIIALFESAKNEGVCLNQSIRKVLDFELLSFPEAVIFALDREDQDKIHTRWSDAYPPAHDLAIKLDELATPDYESSYSLNSTKNASNLFETICRIGGREGWFHNNWMWRTRGMIDRLQMGVGTTRGRRSHSSLRINDVIGFWRIEDLQPNRRLLMRAEMKLPGKAWLEFIIKEKNSENQLTVTAYFYINSLAGKIYWYLFVPFHAILFKALIRDIETKS